MDIIEAGENAVIRLALKDEAAVAIPTANIKSLIIQVIVGGKEIQRWRYLAGQGVPEGMEIPGPGRFTVELKPTSTSGVAGVAEIHVIPTFYDVSFIDTGGQTDVMVIRDLLTIAEP